MRLFFLIPLLYCAFILPLEATYILKNGKVFKKEEVATLSVQEHYALVMEAFEKKNWETLVQQTTIIDKSFPGTPFSDEAVFYSGIAHFHLKEYELSNEKFSNYLKKLSAARHFEEAIAYKFEIAQQFRAGARKHILGWKKMPKWLTARELAIKIYDEVVTALPSHEFAVESLFGKSELLLKNEDYRACIETYQTLIRRFPKHPLAPESYLGIGKVYLQQCQSNSPDPDILELAEINFRKFALDYPGESRHGAAKQMLDEMKEIYANAMHEVGRFFEKSKKNSAAYLYYSHIIQKYPDTLVAIRLRDKVQKLELELAEKQKKEEEAWKAANPTATPEPSSPNELKKEEPAFDTIPTIEPVIEEVRLEIQENEMIELPAKQE